MIVKFVAFVLIVPPTVAIVTSFFTEAIIIIISAWLLGCSTSLKKLSTKTYHCSSLFVVSGASNKIVDTSKSDSELNKKTATKAHLSYAEMMAEERRKAEELKKKGLYIIMGKIATVCEL